MIRFSSNFAPCVELICAKFYHDCCIITVIVCTLPIYCKDKKQSQEMKAVCNVGTLHFKPPIFLKIYVWKHICILMIHAIVKSFITHCNLFARNCLINGPAVYMIKYWIYPYLSRYKKASDRTYPF